MNRLVPEVLVLGFGGHVICVSNACVRACLLAFGLCVCVCCLWRAVYVVCVYCVYSSPMLSHANNQTMARAGIQQRSLCLCFVCVRVALSYCIILCTQTQTHKREDTHAQVARGDSVWRGLARCRWGQTTKLVRRRLFCFDSHVCAIMLENFVSIYTPT